MSLLFNTFWMTGLPFGILMGILVSFMRGSSVGIAVGLFSGLFFGLTFVGFAYLQSRKFTADRPLEPGENLITEGGANRFLNGEYVGGWIYLTDRRLFFKSHNSNLQNHEFIVPLSEIVDATKMNTFGIFPNGLQLVLRGEKTERFVVSGPSRWVKAITGLIKN